MPLRLGDTLENWEIVGEVGEGGMGTVFKGQNRVISDVFAAIKVVHPTDFKQARERFEREIKSLLRLNHPSVVRIQGFGQDPDRGLLWFAMDMVEGKPLEDHMEAGAMDVRTALPLFIALTEGMAHAHQRGVSHRDLKPANVIVQPDGTPVLVDFGISVAAGEGKLTKTGMVVGTPQYLPPEALDGRLDDPNKGDLYALGQMMVEALDGVPAFPFNEELTATQNALRIMHQKVQIGPLSPSGDVPPALVELMKFTTTPEPDDRINTAAELAQALRQVADSLGMSKWGGPTLAPAFTPSEGNKAASTMALNTGGALALPGTAAPMNLAGQPTPPPLQVKRNRKGTGGFMIAGGAAVFITLILLALGATAVAGGVLYVALMPVDKEGLPTEEVRPESEDGTDVAPVAVAVEDPPDGDIVDEPATRVTPSAPLAVPATTDRPATDPTADPSTTVDGPPDGDIVDDLPDGDIVDDLPDGDIVDAAPSAEDPTQSDAVADAPEPEPDPAPPEAVVVSNTVEPDPEPKPVQKINPRWRSAFGLRKGASDNDIRSALGADASSNNLYCKSGEAGRTFKDGTIMVCRGFVGGARRIHIGTGANTKGLNDPKLRLLGLTPKQVIELVGPPDATVNGKMRYAYGNAILDVRSGKVQGILLRL
ncbi:MAG: serine/threonine-protein kinase [Myxococcota bacterium]